MNEREGRAVLLERFRAAGVEIVEDVWIEVDGAPQVKVELDGWDAAKKVGYEYVTTEAGDRVQFDARAIAALEGAMTRGELFVLLIDEHEAVEDRELQHAADGFLAALRARGVLA